MPYRCATGSTSRSTARASREYGGCSVTESFAAAPLGHPLRLDELRRQEGGRAEVADLALVDRSLRAPSVSSMSVSGSGRCTW